MRSSKNRSCGRVVYQAKNHIKLRAMTEYEFCKNSTLRNMPGIFACEKQQVWQSMRLKYQIEIDWEIWRPAVSR